MPNDTSKEILAGSFGGVVQVLVGQPFDTVKVRLQSGGSAYKGTLDCVQKTITQEGFFAFYKGTLSPLAGIAFCVSIQFAVLEQMKRTFKQGDKHLNPLQLYVCGGVAGVANSFVSGPVEHIRTRMQVQHDGRYKSTFDCARQIYNQYGLSGIYKGQGITALREWQGYGAYFLAYELLVQRYCKQNQCQSSQIPMSSVMSFGAAAGYAMWLPIFPIDSVKSRLQTDSLDAVSRRYTGWLDCAKQTLKIEGISGFYRGFLPCMLRAAPVNAATFVAYEFAMRALGGR